MGWIDNIALLLLYLFSGYKETFITSVLSPAPFANTIVNLFIYRGWHFPEPFKNMVSSSHQKSGYGHLTCAGPLKSSNLGETFTAVQFICFHACNVMLLHKLS